MAGAVAATARRPATQMNLLRVHTWSFNSQIPASG